MRVFTYVSDHAFIVHGILMKALVRKECVPPDSMSECLLIACLRAS